MLVLTMGAPSDDHRGRVLLASGVRGGDAKAPFMVAEAQRPLDRDHAATHLEVAVIQCVGCVGPSGAPLKAHCRRRRKRVVSKG